MYPYTWPTLAQFERLRQESCLFVNHGNWYGFQR